MTESLERGLTVLEILGERGEARLVDLVSLAGGSRATVFRLLVGLESRGFVTHDRQEHVYRLGSAINNLASRADATSLIQLAGPVMADLRARFGETVNLAALRRGRIVWVATVDGASSIRHATTIGDEVPGHSTAAGKAILAALPESGWQTHTGAEPFVALTDKTITDLAALRTEVAAVNKRGYAIDDGENEVGGVCLGAAIIGRGGAPLGALSVAGIAQRLPSKLRTSVGQAVQKASDELSASMVRSAPASSTDGAPQRSDGAKTRSPQRSRARQSTK